MKDDKMKLENLTRLINIRLKKRSVVDPDQNLIQQLYGSGSTQPIMKLQVKGGVWADYAPSPYLLYHN